MIGYPLLRNLTLEFSRKFVWFMERKLLANRLQRLALATSEPACWANLRTSDIGLTAPNS